MGTKPVVEDKAQDGVPKALGRVIFFLSFPLGFLSFALPIYGRELGGSALEIGALFSAFFLVAALLRPVVGRLMDRYGRRPFLLLGVAGYGGTALLFGLAVGLPWLLAARLIEGAASSLLWLATYAIVADRSPPGERGRRFGWVDAQLYRGLLVGAFVGFPALDFLGIVRGWKTAWAVYAVLALAALFLAWHGVEESLPPVPPALSVAARPRRPQIAPQLYLFMGIAALTSAASALLTPVLMVFLQERFQAAVHELSIAYVPAAVLHGLLPPYLGRVADRVGRKPPLVVGLVAAAAVSLLIPLAGSMVLIAAAWAVEAVCFSAAAPAQESLVADYCGADARGVGYGLYTLAVGLGATFGPLLGGWAYDAWGPAMPFYWNAGLLLAGALLVGTLVREGRLPRK